MTDRTETNGSPEVAEKPTRRRFNAAYKLRVLDEAEQRIQYCFFFGPHLPSPLP